MNHKIPETRFDLLYNYVLMRKILDKIAFSSPESTVTAIQELARLTLKDLK